MPASPGRIRRRRAEFVVRAAFVCARPPPRLPIDRHPTAGTVAGDGCRLIGRAGGPIGSNASGLASMICRRGNMTRVEAVTDLRRSLSKYSKLIAVRMEVIQP